MQAYGRNQTRTLNPNVEQGISNVEVEFLL